MSKGRITIKMLESIVDELAEKLETKQGTEKGHIYIDQAYGGCKLVRVVSDGGAITEITFGFVPKRELYFTVKTMLQGISMKEGF